MSLAAARRWLHDAWILHVVPYLPSRLPWRLAWPCYRLFARSASLYPEPVSAALAHAPAQLPIGDLAAFARDVRSVWLFDAADLHLSRRHPPGWLPEHVKVRGQWPTGAFVAASFHYGTGLWIFSDLRRNGHESVFVSGRFDQADFARHPLRYRHGMARMAELERLGGQAVAFRPGIRPRLRDALAAGHVVVSLLDVPPRLAPHGQHPARLLDRAASLPEGMLKIAAEAGVPIVPCWIEIDFDRGERTLVIGAPIAPEPIEAALAQLAQLLDSLIRKQPAAWLFWAEWPAWQRDAAALHGAPTFSNVAAEGSLSGQRIEQGLQE
ncbi:hypothetical protein [Dokdonella sp.]|uniref:hypothetical protein n=1 Tax=Dokdonella sp. TaxID=2291710 RepID=UPI0025C43B88|nr:hypothetical protein [Dokdonella sp.]MBX3689164.1 hypothetical protein [Dokdonella sp.]